MAITVEGIEHEAQAEILQRLGCEEGQGYLFARPMPFVDLMVHIEAGRAVAREQAAPE